MENTYSNLKATLAGGKVVRYHTAPNVQGQTVAEHAWGVAVVATYIFGERLPVELLHECLFHDNGELLTGDIPAPFKWHYEDLDKFIKAQEHAFREEQTIVPRQGLTNEQYCILRMSDMLEAINWCQYRETPYIVHTNFCRGFQRYFIKEACEILPEEQLKRAAELYKKFGGEFPLRLNHTPVSEDDTPLS